MAHVGSMHDTGKVQLSNFPADADLEEYQDAGTKFGRKRDAASAPMNDNVDHVAQEYEVKSTA